MTNPTSVDRDPEAVAVFIEETAEALQRLETLLIEAERGQPRADMLDKIFRDVHSLKGNAGYLGYEISRSIAHAAEDLLSNLHDRAQPASPAQCAVLLSAGDQLRQLVANIKANSEEGALDVTALIADLRAAANNETAPKPAPTPEATPEPTHQAADNTDVNDGTVRINLAVLDRLMNLTGELVLAGNQMTQVVRGEGFGTSHGQAVAQRLAQAIAQMQDQVTKTRMQPVSRLFDKVPRMVRDLEKALGKQVGVILHGTGTELDRAVIDAIRDPLMHIVRNAVDHGIEPAAQRTSIGKSPNGALRVSATHTEGMVVIDVEDDGRGMDPRALREQAVRKELITALEAGRLNDQQAIELVFRSGFSTASQVTDISGRGVGMDVVRTQVEKAGGHVEISTQLARGSRIRLKLPLTLAVIPTMLVGAGGQSFAVPQANIVELIAIPPSHLEQVRGSWVCRLRGQILPLARLDALLGLPEQPVNGIGSDKINIVVMQALGQAFGLIVDRIDNTEDIVIKGLDGAIKRLGVYAGATTLSTGGVALVLDAAGLGARAGLVSAQHRVTDATVVAQPTLTTPMLTFRAGNSTLCAVPLTMVARLEEVPTSAIECIAERESLQYGGGLLPIVRPETLLPLGIPAKSDAQPIIVLDVGTLVGIAVSEILDVVEAPLLDEEATLAPLPFVLEQRVLGNRTTLVLDALKLADEARGRRVS